MRGLLSNQPEALDDRCGTFTRLHVWPETTTFNWRGWLSNFRASEQRFARCLLEGFCYFGPQQTSALLKSAFHSISRDLHSKPRTTSRTDDWRHFLGKALVTYVEGEIPSPTDSGYAFARRARDLLGFPEARVVFPRRAVELLKGDPDLPVVFVDDLVGSGNQFVTTWTRADEQTGSSFESIAPVNAWYVPLIASWKGITHIAQSAPTVRLRPAHLLTEEYSANSEKSLIWPKGSFDEAKVFVETASDRAGYSGESAWGLHQLGLAIAVDDTIPDFSLPLFFSVRKGWIPLMRRPE